MAAGRYRGRFALGLGVLEVLAREPGQMQTSATIAEALGSSPVMVRRLFSVLHTAGFILQRKGPQGGAKLKHGAKAVLLGDLYRALEPGWLETGDKAADAPTRKAREAALKAMNDTSLAAVIKKRVKAVG